MANQYPYIGRVRAVEEYDGWAIYPEGSLLKGTRPIAKGIDCGPDGGEAAAKRFVACINAFCGTEPGKSAPETNTIEKQNAGLVKAIKKAKAQIESNPFPGYAPVLDTLGKALENVEGGENA